MNRWLFLAILVFAGGCGAGNDAAKNRLGRPYGQTESQSLAEARNGFSTDVFSTNPTRDPAPAPPAESELRLVKYPAPSGDLSAYLSTPPDRTTKQPAIIWVFGGFSNSIGKTAWEPAPAANDQSARAFRESGVITMYPSLRGGNDNPGAKETLYGEVDDVLAAFDFLVEQPGIDPQRIYLGGHSTGGTLAMLVAESTNQFRAVFAFGPAADVRGYGEPGLSGDDADETEIKLRSPIHWLGGVTRPLFVVEGEERGAIKSLRLMQSVCENDRIHFHPVSGCDHFDVLAKITPLVAAKIVSDDNTDEESTIQFSDEELAAAAVLEGSVPE